MFSPGDLVRVARLPNSYEALKDNHDTWAEFINESLANNTILEIKHPPRSSKFMGENWYDMGDGFSAPEDCLEAVFTI